MKRLFATVVGVCALSAFVLAQQPGPTGNHPTPPPGKTPHMGAPPAGGPHAGGPGGPHHGKPPDGTHSGPHGGYGTGGSWGGSFTPGSKHGK